MAKDYIPTKDGDLVTYAEQFKFALSEQEVTLGFALDYNEHLADEIAAFSNALITSTAAQNNARVKRQIKDAAKTALINALRNEARLLQANPAMTDAIRAEMGITIPDKTPTKVPVPATRPILEIGTAQRLKHIVKFTDENTPNSKAKPNNVFGMKVFRFIGNADPATLGDYSLLDTATATPYESNFAEADAGKKAFYIGCWVNRAGEAGPQSQVVSATIVG